MGEPYISKSAIARIHRKYYCCRELAKGKGGFDMQATLRSIAFLLAALLMGYLGSLLG